MFPPECRGDRAGHRVSQPGEDIATAEQEPQMQVREMPLLAMLIGLEACEPRGGQMPLPAGSR